MFPKINKCQTTCRNCDIVQKIFAICERDYYKWPMSKYAKYNNKINNDYEWARKKKKNHIEIKFKDKTVFILFLKYNKYWEIYIAQFIPGEDLPSLGYIYYCDNGHHLDFNNHKKCNKCLFLEFFNIKMPDMYTLSPVLMVKILQYI